MSAKSRAQFRFMKMAEHSPDKMKNKPKGLTPEKAKEFTESNVGKKKYSKLKEYVSKKNEK